jgi:hypothetical protein
MYLVHGIADPLQAGLFGLLLEGRSRMGGHRTQDCACLANPKPLNSVPGVQAGRTRRAAAW